MLKLIGDMSALNPSQRKEAFNKYRQRGKKICDHIFCLTLLKVQEEIFSTSSRGIVIVKDKNHLLQGLSKEIQYINSFFYGLNSKVVLAVPEV